MTIESAITRARAALLNLQVETAQIRHTPMVSDGRGGEVPGTPEVSGNVLCNVQAELSAEERVIAERLGVVVPYIVRLPVGTVVVSADQVLIGSRTLEVVAPLDTSIQLTLRVLCKEIG